MFYMLIGLGWNSFCHTIFIQMLMNSISMWELWLDSSSFYWIWKGLYQWLVDTDSGCPRFWCLSCWSVCYFMTISLVIAKFSGLFQVFKVYVDWGSTTWHFCSPRSIKLITSNIKLVLDSLSWWDFGFVRKETNFLLTIWSVGWQFVILMGQNGFFSNFLEVRDGRALCLPYSQYCIKNKN